MQDQLAALDRSIQKAREEESKNQNRDLEDKRKRRAALLKIKKMKIEAKQIDAQTKKELEVSQNKFDKQIESMNDTLEKKLDGQTQMIVGGKEQALIMVNEAHEDLLDKKLKVMRSKQFFDLSK